MAEPYFLRPGEQRRTIGPFRVLADAESGTQDLTLYEALLPPGGPPLHRHEFDEAFYVLEGLFRLRVGDVVQDLPPGSFAFSPAGSVHTFANPGSGVVRVLGLGAPATVLGMFAEREQLLAQLARGEALTAEQTAELYRRHASEVLGPPLLDPLRRR